MIMTLLQHGFDAPPQTLEFSLRPPLQYIPVPLHFFVARFGFGVGTFQMLALGTQFRRDSRNLDQNFSVSGFYS